MNFEKSEKIQQILSYIPEYESIGQEIARQEKYGISHRVDIGIWRQAVLNLHPGKMKMMVTDKYSVSPTSIVLRLVRTDGPLPPFQAGNYVNVAVEMNGIHIGRPYSISSSPTQRGYIEITVGRKRADGFVSDCLIDEIKTGDVLQVNEPSGHFVYNPVFHGKDLVFLAGGIGITPFLSMIREKADRGLNDRKIHLIYGCRTADDVPFRDELEHYAKTLPNFRFSLVISEPDAEWTGLTGFLSAENLTRAGVTGEESSFYLCGPTVMYQFCIPELEKLNIPRKKIRRELIVNSKDAVNDPGWPSDVDANQVFNLTVDGQTTIPARADETILAAMERAGIAHPSNCRGGECGNCRVHLDSGKVFQPSTTKMRTSDQKYGNIYACSSYPISDVSISR